LYKWCLTSFLKRHSIIFCVLFALTLTNMTHLSCSTVFCVITVVLCS
jgi:hypothetical protein